MKKFLFIFGLVLSITTMVAQETPKNIKRYDYKKVGEYQYDKYTVMTITDCISNEKEYKLKISYSIELTNKEKEKKVLYLSEAVVAEMINAFSYLYTTIFELGVDGEESFIIYEISNGLFFKYRIYSHHLELIIDDNQVMPSIYDVYDDDDIYNEYKAKSRQHVLAHIYTESDMKDFGVLLQKIEKTFTEKGRDLKDAVIPDDDKKESQKIQI